MQVAREIATAVLGRDPGPRPTADRANPEPLCRPALKPTPATGKHHAGRGRQHAQAPVALVAPGGGAPGPRGRAAYL